MPQCWTLFTVLCLWIAVQHWKLHSFRAVGFGSSQILANSFIFSLHTCLKVLFLCDGDFALCIPQLPEKWSPGDYPVKGFDAQDCADCYCKPYLYQLTFSPTLELGKGVSTDIVSYAFYCVYANYLFGEPWSGVCTIRVEWVLIVFLWHTSQKWVWLAGMKAWRFYKGGGALQKGKDLRWPCEICDLLGQVREKEVKPYVQYRVKHV